MIKNSSIILFLAVIFLQCNMDSPKVLKLEPLLMDAAYLEEAKTRIDKNDPTIMPAYKKLVDEAEKAMLEGPFSVTDKERFAPSNDPNDYASYSRYWWPDPESDDGLPYIRKDGITNPESQSLKSSDRQRLGAFGKNVETLGLAYYFTGDKKYADKAAELLRVWFLDSLTHMNPHLNHAQCRPGHNLGTKSGVLDGRILIMALEGSLLISPSTAISSSEYEKLKSWSAEYLDWLTTDEMALDEAKSENNHGTFYDVQALYFALYSKNLDIARQVAEKFGERRVLAQIEEDGSMPEEMARTRPLFYSIFNLHAMFLAAHLSEKVDVDVWRVGEGKPRLRASVDLLVPYVDSKNPWPKASVKKLNYMEFYPVLQMADMAYPDGGYMEYTKLLSEDEREVDRVRLAVFLMR